MISIICEGVLSAILFLSGAALIITHFSKITEKETSVIFITSMGLLLVSLILLIIMLRTLMTYLAKRKTEDEAVETVVVTSNSLIQRNSAIVNDWEKTNESRDKLKLLEMASGTEEK